MRPRDAVSGFAVFAFARDCARRTAWLRGFAIAAAWSGRCAGLDLTDWREPVFGSRLAELTGPATGVDGQSPARPMARPRPAAPAPAVNDRRGHKRVAEDVGGQGGRRNAGRPHRAFDKSREQAAAARTPSSITDETITATTRRTSRPVPSATGPVRIAHARLAAIAAGPRSGPGQSVPARMSAGRRRSSPGVATSPAAVARPAFVGAAEAASRLGRSLERRLQRVMARQSGVASSLFRPIAAWRDPLGAPETGLRLAPPEPTGAARPEGAATPATARPGLQALRDRPGGIMAPESANPGNAGPPAGDDTASAGARAVRQMASPAPPPARTRSAASDGVVADLAAHGQRRARLNPFEFAEQLRDALVTDARRHGIDV